MSDWMLPLSQGQGLHMWTLTTSLNPLHLSQHLKLSPGSEKYLALHTYNTSNTEDTMAWAHDLLKMSWCQRAVKEPPCVLKQNTAQASLISPSHSPSGRTLKLAFKCQLSEAHQPFSCGPQALGTRGDQWQSQRLPLAPQGFLPAQTCPP